MDTFVMLRFSFPTSGAETGSLKLTCVALAINNEENCGNNESLFSSVVFKDYCSVFLIHHMQAIVAGALNIMLNRVCIL